MANDSQNDTTKTEQNDNDAYSAISQAMASGNEADLARLMAGEEPVTNEALDKPKDEPIFKEDQADENKDDQSGQDDNVTKEAADAASTGATTPEELLALKEELHRLRSAAGRVDHLQRTVQELQRQVRAEPARQTPATKEPIPPKTQSKPELPDSLKAKLTSLKEIDPELADTFEAFANAMSDQTERKTNEVRQTFEERQREQEDARHWQEQKAELYKLVPRCDEVFAMPEWSEWKQRLTPGQRGLAESGYAPDMAQAIYMFANHMQQQQQAMNGTRNQSASSEGGDPTNTNAGQRQAAQEDNKEVLDARARKVGAAVEVKSTAAKKDATLDEAAFFKEMYNKIGKENHIL